MAEEESKKSNAASTAVNLAMAAKKAQGAAKKALAMIKMLASPAFWIAIGIFLLIVIVTNFVQIIFNYLGYDTASDYVKDSVKIEAANLTSGVQDIFSNLSYRSDMDKAFFTYDGTVYSITGMEMPSSGIGTKDYMEIERDYVNTITANANEFVIYEGYTVENKYNDFWNGTYVSYLLPIIQERLGTDQIKQIQKKDSSAYAKCVKKLISSLNKYKWFSVEELPDTVTYEERIVISDDPQATTEQNTQIVVYTHITKNYRIGMKEVSTFHLNSENYSFRKVTDPSTFETVHDMFQDLKDGKYGKVLFDVSSGLVKSLWNKIKAAFQKDYSWREMTVRTGYGDGDGNSTTTGDGSYTPIGDITIPAGAEADTFLLAALVKAEAGNQPYEGQAAVAYVVLNRMSQRQLDMHSVIFQEGQFACVDDGNFNKAMTALSAIAGDQLMSDSSYNAAAAAISGSVNNPIGSMCFFMRPGSASQSRILAHNVEGEYKIIGDHWFFTNW